MGENKKIKNNVGKFFELISDGQFNDACDIYGTKDLCSMNSNNLSQSINLFALELSLVKYYNLLGEEKYQVKLARDETWLPFNKNNISLSIKLQRRKNKISDIFYKDKSRFINSLIEVQRVDGEWKISTVDISNAAISNEYSRILRKIDAEKHIVIRDNQITLHDIEVDRENISDEDVRIILHILDEFKNIVHSK